MSDTPRFDRLTNGIDARQQRRGFNMPEDLRDALDLARQLERELSEANARIEKLEADAARYRFVRDVPYTENIRLIMRDQCNAIMDKAIDEEIKEKS